MWPYAPGSARDVLAYIDAVEMAIRTLEIAAERHARPLVLL